MTTTRSRAARAGRAGSTTGRRRTAAGLLTASALALTGCAGPGATDTDPDPAAAAAAAAAANGVTGVTGVPEPTATGRALSRDPLATYVAYLDALRREDAAEACRLQHPLRTIELRQEAVLVDRAELGDPCVGFEALLWEDPLRSLDAVAVETTQDTGERATLAVTFAPGSPTARVTVDLLLQRAAWRVRAEQRRDGGVGDTDRWVGAWCGLATSDSRSDVVARMGAPSGEYTVADGGEPQLYWASDQYDFRVYLDPVTGEVLDLVGDYDALSAADRSRLSCPELR